MPTILISDFNGHFGFIGDQKSNKTGQMITDWLQKHNLILLNNGANCDGIHILQWLNQKSIIEYLSNNFIITLYV